MRKPIAFTLSLALAALSIAAPALAQDQHNTQTSATSGSGGQCSNTVSGRDQTLCFEGSDVSGGVVGPDGQSVHQIRPVHGGNLLPMRAHFLPQMLHSVENL